ncbi:MAG: type II toxin-antitoxin system mRNA interferase toxin, RelE/StbE family [Chloroflexi bacterium]|nr:type II toxin-antitoxin system mRNA interferase toxin, RelE/StbE family [Chloroflexota bacterium]
MSEQPRIHEDALHGIPPRDVTRILDKVEWLWQHRAEIIHHPLGENLSEFYKKRVGKYRIIYSYDENPDDLVVRLVGTRDSIYQEATKKLTD